MVWAAHFFVSNSLVSAGSERCVEKGHIEMVTSMNSTWVRFALLYSASELNSAVAGSANLQWLMATGRTRTDRLVDGRFAPSVFKPSASICAGRAHAVQQGLRRLPSLSFDDPSERDALKRNILLAERKQ